MTSDSNETTGTPSDLGMLIQALSNPVRLNILRWLKEPLTHFPNQSYGQELGVCMGQIVNRAGLSQSTVSRHMTLLQEVGLIDVFRTGSVHFFKRNEPSFLHLKAALKKELQGS